MQLREGPVTWVRDLNASTSTTVIPTATTAGVAIPDALAAGRLGARVHVLVDHGIASGTLSLVVHLYGLPRNSGDMTTGTPRWSYLGSFNNGSSMAQDAKWSGAATSIRVAEVFTVSPANYERLATAQYAPGGTSPATTTYIGFPVE